MNIFKNISRILFINKLKEKIYEDKNEDITEEERNDIEKIKRQNPFGLLAMILGGASFAFGPIYVIIPIITIVFCIVTFGTFDSKKEDNPWTFFIGFIFSLIGLYMYVKGLLHEMII